MRAVLGSEPSTVDCRAWNPPWSGYHDPPEATAIVDFADGVTVSYHGSRLHPERPTAWAGESVCRPGAAPDRIDLPHLELMDRAGSLDAFTRALADGTTPESTAAENLGSLALACAAVRSAECREPVPVTTSGRGGISQ